MSNVNDPSQGQELRDPSGLALGIFVPNPVVRDLTAERDRLRAEVARHQKEAEHLRHQLAAETAQKAEIEAERDRYLQVLMREFPPPTAEEIAEAERSGVDLDQVIAQIEEEARQLQGKGP